MPSRRCMEASPIPGGGGVDSSCHVRINESVRRGIV